MRRTIDIIIALGALVLLAPLLLPIALAVVAESRGNPFYLGWRVGKGGKNFRMWKFRTMVKGADKAGPITGRHDPRVTRLGRLMRKTKIDELPQFVNLLLGDMTLVGPRPESPEIVALYTPSQHAVLDVKPGITGRVQLAAGEESETIPEGIRAEEYYVQHLMDHKVRLDLDYLRNRTAASDARIVGATVLFVLRALLRV